MTAVDLTDLDEFTRADAGLVVAQLSYRANVTRRASAFLHRLTSLYGPFGEDPHRIARWTDQRIAYAVGRGTLPAVHDPFPQRVNHNAADSYLTVAQLAFRGGLSSSQPSMGFIQQRYGLFSSSGPEFVLRWTDQRMREAAARFQHDEWQL